MHACIQCLRGSMMTIKLTILVVLFLRKHQLTWRVDVTLRRHHHHLPAVIFTPPSLCTVCPSHCPALIVIWLKYTLMLILLLAVLMCSFWFLVHRDFPIATIIPPSASRSPSPLLLPPHPLPCSPFEVTRVLFWGFLTPQKLSVAPFLPMSGTHNREKAPAERFSSH